ncbi:MAG: hypothetical protein P8N60_04175 [Burkholderiaceae bacterium]|nr:hypothetical protein [Burkholderiaceae bacterium]
MQIQMSTDNQDPRALLAKMKAEQDAAVAKVAELAQTNEAKRKALLEQIREGCNDPAVSAQVKLLI